MRARSSSALRAQPGDALLILLATAIAAAFSRTWVGFNTPDSEFYASYAIFGGDVAERAIDAAYTWTRLGVIAPTRGLVLLFGPWWGFGIWRVLLIAAVVTGIYVLVRLASTRALAFSAGLLAALSSVVLSYAGSTYLSGTVIALIALLLAVGAWGAFGTPHGLLGLPWPSLIAGALLAWLVMANPYGMLLGLASWLGIRIVGVVAVDRRSMRLLLADVLGVVVGFAVVFLAFLMLGAALFPGRSWLGTYLEWNGRLDYAAFVGDWTTWQRDTAFLVPVLALVLAGLAAVVIRNRWAFSALGVSVGSLGFTALYMAIQPGPWLEAPTYLALLWPAALASIALCAAAVAGARPAPRWWPVLLVVGVPLVIWAGHWDRDIPYASGIIIALLLLALFAVLLVLRRRSWVVPLVIAWLVLVALGGQVLQNGRGFLGTYGQFPFRAAYVDFDARLLMGSRVDAEAFVLANTRPGDRIGIWTDPARMTAGLAGMQLWGDYTVVGFADTLQPTEVARLTTMRPTVIAMYAPTREAIDVFWSSLQGVVPAAPPVCTEVPYLGIGSPTATVCLTRITG